MSLLPSPWLGFHQAGASRLAKDGHPWEDPVSVRSPGFSSIWVAVDAKIKTKPFSSHLTPFLHVNCETAVGETSFFTHVLFWGRLPPLHPGGSQFSGLSRTKPLLRGSHRGCKCHSASVSLLLLTACRGRIHLPSP